MAKKNHVYIELINFVKEKTTETGVITFDECNNFLKGNYSELTNRSKQDLIGDVTARVQTPHGERGGAEKRRLKIESYFHLLEHEVLEEARASSKTALRYATFALIVSIVVGAFSIFFQIYQLNTTSEVRIDASQYEQLRKAAPPPDQLSQ